MARITVEDCIDKVDNRFDLILLAAHRARELSVGASATLDVDDEKMSVVALREIAAENVKADDLKGSLVRTMQTFVERETAPESNPENTPEPTAESTPEQGEEPTEVVDADDAALAALNALFEDATEDEIED